MSDSHVKKPPPNGPVSLSGMYIPWRLVPSEPGESVRWENVVDGRWVAIALGQDDEAGQTIVTSSEFGRQVVDSYDAALDLAKRWRQP